MTDFETELKAWLEENWEPDLTVREWWQRLGESGCAAPTRQVEWYGKGLSRAEGVQVSRIMRDFGALGATGGLGLLLAGPTIATHGSDEQKDRYLRDIVTGAKGWCQLFSEPGAGSDLAGLGTRAVRDGDEFVVNGQKVWNSGAHYSDWGILLARTDPTAPKHRGITYFLVDMRTPGIDVRPLRQITGQAHFNEVFLSDVRIPVANVLGAVNDGWRVAQTTLANERALIGGGAGSGWRDVGVLARETGAGRDPVLRQELAAAFTRFELTRFLGYRVQTALSQGKAPGPEVSIMKLFHSQNLARTGD